MNSDISSHNPFPGPRPFSENEKDQFFGRDEERDDLVTLISAHRLVFLYAESGIGKTSLLNAGLVQALKEEGFDVLPIVRVSDPLPPKLNLAPQDIGNIFIFNTLLSLAPDDSNIASLAKQSLSEFLNQLGPPLKPRVIVFDQFEDLFTAFPERRRDRTDFFVQLDEAMKEAILKNQGLRVLFVLREDYLAIFQSYVEALPEWPGVGYRLERMRREAAQLAIEEPLKGTGRSFAPGVALALVDLLRKVPTDSTSLSQHDVLSEFIEPVHLQIVCHRLWEKLPENTSEIKLGHLKLLGDINRPLADYYDATVAKVARQTGIQEENIRNWFERHLITKGKTRGTVFAEKEETGGLPTPAVDLLNRMYLIKSEWRSNAQWYELTHDRFIEPILQANQRWREQHIKLEEKGRGRLRYLRLIGIFIFLLAALSGTITSIAPPASTGISYTVAIASILTLGIFLLLDSIVKRSKIRVQKIIWWSLAVILFLSTVLTFLLYARNNERLTVRFPPDDPGGVKFVVGDQLTPAGLGSRAINPAVSNGELVEALGVDDIDKIWTPESIKAANRTLSVSYIAFILSLAGFLFCCLEGVSVTQISLAPETYLGDTPSSWETGVLGLYLVVTTLVLAYFTFSLWPETIVDAAGTLRVDPRISLFGGLIERWIGPEQRFIFLVLCVGGLGSLIHLATSFADFVGNNRLKRSWMWWYILRPFVGMTLAVVLYFVVRGGFLLNNSQTDTLNPFGITGLAALSGMFSKQAVDKLIEVVNNVFSSAARKKS